MKVSELTGALLDYWVAKAEGWDFFWSKHNHWVVTRLDGNQYRSCQEWQPFNSYSGKKNEIPHPSEALEDFYPSSDWSLAGPIIEREKITVVPGAFGVPWTACEDWSRDPECNKWIDGETYLIAAMRCFVASKFGDEVPDEVRP